MTANHELGRMRRNWSRKSLWYYGWRYWGKSRNISVNVRGEILTQDQIPNDYTCGTAARCTLQYQVQIWRAGPRAGYCSHISGTHASSSADMNQPCGYKHGLRIVDSVELRRENERSKKRERRTGVILDVWLRCFNYRSYVASNGTWRRQWIVSR